MFKKDFEEMSIKEIEATFKRHLQTFGIDGILDVLTPWDCTLLIKELLERIRSLNKESDEGKNGTE